VLLEAFPGGAKVADDEGYLPLHLALDCARPSPELCSALLEVFPEAAFHKSRDGLLPLHCLISALQPSVEAVQLLLSVFPEAAEAVAVDLIPADEMADPEGWTGDWLEKRWTPLSRAIDRGLDAIVVLFRDALHRVRLGDRPNPLHSSPPLVMHNTINSNKEGGATSNMVSTATNRNLPPQQGGRPPLHAPISPRSPRQGQEQAAVGGGAVHTGPGYDHAASHHHRPVTAPMNNHHNSAQGGLVLGGQLDMTVADPSQIAQVQPCDNAHAPNSNSKPRDMRPVSAAPSLANRMAPGGLIAKDRDRERGDRNRERNPHDGRSREKDDGRSPEKDRERRDDDRNRDRDRRREPSRERGQSRDREASRDRGHKHRSSSRHRSSDRDRDREYRSSDRDRDRDRRRQSRGSYNDNSYFDEAQEEDPNYYDSNSPVRQNNFMSTPSSNYNKGNAPSSAPPRSLLEAAINRPFSRTNTGGISHDTQKDFRNSRDEAEYGRGGGGGNGGIQLDMAGFTGNANELNINGANPGYHSPDELV